MDSQLDDFKLIQKAEFTPLVKTTVEAAVSALHYLKGLSKRLDIPIEQITARHIIDGFSEPDAKMREHQAWLDSLPDDKRG